MQRMGADGDRRRERLAAFLGAALELEHAAARMQRQAEAVPALEHQPVKPRGVDAGYGIARRDLAGRDVGAAIDGELQRDRQAGEVEVLAVDHDLVPGGVIHDFAGDGALAALAKRVRQLLRRDAEAGGIRRSSSG